MKQTEITKVFAVLKIAYPNSKMFDGTDAELKMTAELWTACLNDIPFWNAQIALKDICNKLKFPPTIAEFREACEHTQAQIREACLQSWQALKWARSDDPFEIYDSLRPGSYERMAVDLMGGPTQIFVSGAINDKPYTMLNYEGFTQAFTQIWLRGQTSITGGKVRMLEAGGQR